MPFHKWIHGLGEKGMRDLQTDLVCVYLDGKIDRPLSRLPKPLLIKYFDMILNECHTRGIDLEAEYSNKEQR